MGWIGGRLAKRRRLKEEVATPVVKLMRRKKMTLDGFQINSASEEQKPQTQGKEGFVMAALVWRMLREKLKMKLLAAKEGGVKMQFKRSRKRELKKRHSKLSNKH